MVETKHLEQSNLDSPNGLAESIPAGSAATHQFLSFALPPDGQAVLPTEKISEILNLTPSQISPVAGMPLQVMGVCNWRGEILWLVDLGSLLGKSPLYQQQYRPTSYSTLVVRHHSQVIGFVVNQINQIHPYDPAEILQLSSVQTAKKFPTCLQGYWISPQGETLWVLDSEAMVNQFQPAA
jgi:positive phototaxis protein PixI